MFEPHQVSHHMSWLACLCQDNRTLVDRLMRGPSLMLSRGGADGSNAATLVRTLLEIYRDKAGQGSLPYPIWCAAAPRCRPSTSQKLTAAVIAPTQSPERVGNRGASSARRQRPTRKRKSRCFQPSAISYAPPLEILTTADGRCCACSHSLTTSF
jgi:hypothetical protein